jgi:hypothetical protein
MAHHIHRLVTTTVEFSQPTIPIGPLPICSQVSILHRAYGGVAAAAAGVVLSRDVPSSDHVVAQTMSAIGHRICNSEAQSPEC